VKTKIAVIFYNITAKVDYLHSIFSTRIPRFSRFSQQRFSGFLQASKALGKFWTGPYKKSTTSKGKRILDHVTLHFRVGKKYVAENGPKVISSKCATKARCLGQPPYKVTPKLGVSHENL